MKFTFLPSRDYFTRPRGEFLTRGAALASQQSVVSKFIWKWIANCNIQDKKIFPIVNIQLESETEIEI